MIQSIDRAMRIVKVLISDENKMDWQISELATATGLPISTLHRILETLISHGLVSQEPITKQYRAGYTWMEIGFRLHDKIDLRHVARPVMERLAAEVEESIFISIPAGDDSFPIEKVDGPLKVIIAENLGARVPLTIGAPNKAILANWKYSDAERVVRKQLPPDQQQAFLDQLVEIKKAGYAISYGEKTEGTVAIASPIIGYGNTVVAVVFINAPSFRVPNDRLPLLSEKVKAAAAEISMKIGRA